MIEWERISDMRAEGHKASLHGISLTVAEVSTGGRWKWFAGSANGEAPSGPAAKRAAVNSAIDQFEAAEA